MSRPVLAGSTFLGLVPGELSPGYLLVEAAWRIIRSKQDDTAARVGIVIANRRGKRIAVVALARRLAGILYAMWRDNKTFDATCIRMPRPRTVTLT